jgi:diguanylate cyclase (GGDEF)-like protein
MENALVHEIELYSFESFKSLLDHEVNRSRRYQTPLTLIHLAIETDPAGPQTQHSAEMFVINILDLHLRDTDIPCRKGVEFLVLMPATDLEGGRIACERLARLLNVKPQMYDRVSFKLSAFLGMATLPGDRSISSAQIIQQALQAMTHARTNRILNPVLFSEMAK